eukprot:15470033-Alexandrium_andersonii.AAC.1
MAGRRTWLQSRRTRLWSQETRGRPEWVPLCPPPATSATRMSRVVRLCYPVRGCGSSKVLRPRMPLSP